MHKGVQDIWAIGKSPIKIEPLLNYLQEYPLKNVVNELSDGFVNGFRLKYTGPRIHRVSPNLLSAYQHQEELKEKVRKEINLGRVAGPFDNLPISNLQISPVGIVLKSDGLNWRLISHLSYPPSNGINAFIDPKFCTVKYTSFDRVVEMLSQLGKGAEMGVIDIKSAFRLLRVYPGDFDLLGFQIEGKYYIDKCLPMGCAISCNIFEQFSTFLHWLVEKKSGMKTLDHYLDDFFFAGQKHSNYCKNLMNCFLDICHELGIPIAQDKLVGPVTNLIFLGLELDTLEMCIKIPAKKLESLITDLQYFLNQNRITLKNLQSLVGSLNFFSKAVRSARAFNRRFYDLMSRAKKPYHFIKLNTETKEDMRMWLYFLQSFNGKTYFPQSSWSDSDVLELFTDSAGSADLGCGAYFSGQWAYFPWPKSWEEEGILKDMTFLEFVPVVLAIAIWGDRFQNQKIIFNIDNLSLVNILNSQTSKSKRVMALIRPFILYTLRNNVVFKAKHIFSKSNFIADAISRQQWDRFRTLAPQAQLNPQEIPVSFRQMICKMKLNGL